MDRNNTKDGLFYRLATPRVPHDERHNAEVNNERLAAIKKISPVEEKEEVFESEDENELIKDR